MRTFSKVYDNYQQAENVVRDLETAGVPSGDISIMANKSATDTYVSRDETSAAASGAGIGAAVGGGAGLLAGLGLLAIPGLGPVVAAGWFAPAAVGALAGTTTGGIIGALVDIGTPEHDAQVYSEAVRRGGTLVTVRTSHAPEGVAAILDRYQPIDPDSRRREYEEAGWTTVGPDAPAYRPDPTEIDRTRRPTV